MIWQSSELNANFAGSPQFATNLRRQSIRLDLAHIISMRSNDFIKSNELKKKNKKWVIDLLTNCAIKWNHNFTAQQSAVTSPVRLVAFNTLRCQTLIPLDLVQNMKNGEADFFPQLEWKTWENTCGCALKPSEILEASEESDDIWWPISISSLSSMIHSKVQQVPDLPPVLLQLFHPVPQTWDQNWVNPGRQKRDLFD